LFLLFYLFLLIDTGSGWPVTHYLAQVGLKFMILMFQLPKCLFSVLGIEPKTSPMLATTDLSLQSLFLLLLSCILLHLFFHLLLPSVSLLLCKCVFTKWNCY
jgi:hypothetical protein